MNCRNSTAIAQVRDDGNLGRQVTWKRTEEGAVGDMSQYGEAREAERPRTAPRFPG